MHAKSGSNRYRIGLVADTHDAEHPIEVVEALVSRACDYNIHLGDIGGSPSVMRVVREFKSALGKAESLPPRQRSEFRRLIDEGKSALSAYIEARLGEHDRDVRLAETTDAYRAILTRMARLANPILLRGNVDGRQLGNPLVQQCFDGGPLQLVERPRLIDLGWLGLVVWPSWRTSDPAELAEQAELTDALADEVASKEMVVVVAHEQCLKGPISERYAANVARVGLRQRSIPRFDPNPTWRCLLSLFRRLPAEVPCYYAFGHVHDPLEVIVAGAPALRNRSGPGLRYRLYGLAWRGQPPKRPNGRRSIVQLPVGVDEVAICEVRRDRLSMDWQVFHPQASVRE